MKIFALVGCGHIAQRHAALLSEMATLAAVCDTNLAKAQQLASAYKARPYASLEELLAAEKDVDTVVVCTPNGLHAEHSIKSLQAGKHVLCEKPMCLTAAAAWQMVDTAHLCRRKLFVVNQNRYHPAVQYVWTLLQEGRLGKIFSFQVNGYWHRSADYYNSEWRGHVHLDGGTLYTQFSHFVDLLVWWLGPVAQVHSFAGNYQKQGLVDFEDTGTATLHMSSGAVGSFHYTVSSPNRNIEGSVTLFGEKGGVKIGGPYLNRIEWLEIEGEAVPVGQEGWPAVDTEPAGAENHRRLYAELLSSGKASTTLVEGHEAVQTIQKIYGGTTRV